MRVLLIEDDSAIAQGIELMLKSQNFDVYTIDLNEEGIDLGKLYDYDIILIDINLPDLSGYDVLKSLRAAKIKTPIIVLSGLSSIENKIRNMNSRHRLKLISEIPVEYDERKHHKNLEKHNINFNIAKKFNHNSLLTTFDIKKEYGEARKIGIGMIDNTLYFVVYVRRGRNYRIISLRKANEKERNLYDKAINEF